MSVSRSSPARSPVVLGLVALNVALVVLLALRLTGEKPAMAQVAALSRPGDYLMISGEVVGGNDAVVYILSQSSRQLSAMVYDGSSRQIKAMPPIGLDRILAAPAGNGVGGSRSRTLQE